MTEKEMKVGRFLLNQIYLGDSLDIVKDIPSTSIDLILEDMPYNTTACEWDVKIDLELYWKTRLRILKSTGAIVLTATQPFISELVMSNRKMFKYEWVWNKKRPTNFLNAKKEPLRQHENILVFSKRSTLYNPIMHKNKLNRDFRGKLQNSQTDNYGKQREFVSTVSNEESYPRSILEITAVTGNSGSKQGHPTQKPVGLFEYLIRTYTNESDLVFDGFGGSGTTAVACHKCKRNFIVIEKEQKYFDLATRRLDDERRQLSLL